jgi:hypothetical protein
VVDFHNAFGVEIDRKANKKKGIREFNPMMIDMPNLTIFTPENPIAMLGTLIK